MEEEIDRLSSYFSNPEASDAPGNILHNEEMGKPTSIAELAGQISPAKHQFIADRIATTDTQDNIENLANPLDALDVSSMRRPNPERVAERLGTYYRLLSALRRNIFTSEDKEHMEELQSRIRPNNELSFSKLWDDLINLLNRLYYS